MKVLLVNRFASWRLFFLLICFLYGGPGNSQVDPLLRQGWTATERERAAGFAGYISSRLERTQERIALTDEDGRRFSMGFSGDITFSPLQGDWRPVIPDTSRTPFHLAEAQGLMATGLKDEALLVYKALVAMSLFTERPAADVREQARLAARAINVMRKGSDFSDLDLVTDPFLFYDPDAGETVVLSDRQGFRLRLPGKYTFRRGRSEAVSRTHERTIIYLKQADLVLALGADLWSRAYKMATIPQYVHVRDGRRPLTVQLRETLSFQRTPVASTRCGSREWPLCQLYRSSLRGMGLVVRPPDKTLEGVYEATTEGDRYTEQIFEFFEFYHLRPNRGFYAELRFTGEDRAARSLIDALIEKAVFATGRSD